ncbi:MAG: uroporphyrinogen decarboxylase [Kiritimatiellae bacterium]|nr:uroporphyrinogen decarboxylase [Kiritimatiellia bacterium]
MAVTQAEAIDRFVQTVRGRDRDARLVAWIVDSPWLPGWIGADTLDFFFDATVWMRAYERAQCELDGSVLIPGGWIELGMAAEPSGFGAPVRWNRCEPPNVLPHPAGLEALRRVDPPDPESDGLMPVILAMYEQRLPAMTAAGFPPRIAAARGPLAVAGHLLGITELLLATQTEPDAVRDLLARTTALCIAWLRAQLARMDRPVGVLVLDDLVGMLGPADAETFAFPFLRQVFRAFPDLIHLFHNDTPNPEVYYGLRDCGVDVFNFSHEVDPADARARVGPDIVLMGNLPPVELLVRGAPEECRAAVHSLLDRWSELAPWVLSAGGGVSPGTPLANLRAVIEAAGVAGTA